MGFNLAFKGLTAEFYTIKTCGEIDVQHIAMNSSPCHLIKVIRQPHASALSPRSPHWTGGWLGTTVGLKTVDRRQSLALATNQTDIPRAFSQ